MARCLIGLFVLAAGFVALASMAKDTRSSVEPTTPTNGPRLRETEAVTLSGSPRTLLLPAPVFGACFSLN